MTAFAAFVAIVLMSGLLALAIGGVIWQETVHGGDGWKTTEEEA